MHYLGVARRARSFEGSEPSSAYNTLVRSLALGFLCSECGSIVIDTRGASIDSALRTTVSSAFDDMPEDEDDPSGRMLVKLSLGS